MAVPAHDERDFEFAKQFDLPIIPVVDPPADDPNRDAILAGDVCFVAKAMRSTVARLMANQRMPSKLP